MFQTEHPSDVEDQSPSKGRSSRMDSIKTNEGEKEMVRTVTPMRQKLERRKEGVRRPLSPSLEIPTSSKRARIDTAQEKVSGREDHRMQDETKTTPQGPGLHLPTHYSTPLVYPAPSYHDQNPTPSIDAKRVQGTNPNDSGDPTSKVSSTEQSKKGDKLAEDTDMGISFEGIGSTASMANTSARTKTSGSRNYQNTSETNRGLLYNLYGPNPLDRSQKKKGREPLR